VLISFLSVFVFYLPTDAGEKMTLSISILLALVVFLLLISKILPPTSIVIPLIAKYLLFTLIMNITTIFFTVVTINYNYRTPRTHKMPNWIRRLCIDILPRILRMERPKKYEREDNINITEADRAKQTMLNYMQASRALSIASPVTMNNNNTNDTTNHYDQQLELRARHTSKKKHHHHHHHHHHQNRHSSKRQQSNENQSSTTDDEENPITTEELDILLTKEAYEAAEDLSFIANHMRTACRYEEVFFQKKRIEIISYNFCILDS
jgi:nicotinic acetylcholine receptor